MGRDFTLYRQDCWLPGRVGESRTPSRRSGCVSAEPANVERPLQFRFPHVGRRCLFCGGSMLSRVWRETRECALKHGISRSFVRPGTVRLGKGLVSARRNHGSAQFFRLFLVPGVHHGGGGPGFTGFDSMTALEKVGREGTSARKVDRLTIEQRCSGTVAACLSIPRFGAIFRHWQPQASRQFRTFRSGRSLTRHRLLSMPE